MSMSAYEVTIPTMLRGLGVLDHYLDEASKLTVPHNKSITDVLGARLAPDMLNFAEQINIACSKAERHAAALCQLDRSATSLRSKRCVRDCARRSGFWRACLRPTFRGPKLAFTGFRSLSSTAGSAPAITSSSWLCPTSYFMLRWRMRFCVIWILHW